MPPKTANRKSGLAAPTTIALWYHCQKCDVHITLKERDAHEEICPIPANNSNACGQDFIRNGVLCTGSLECLSFTVEEIKEMPKKFANNLVFISESIMRLANWCIGQYVQIGLLNDNLDRSTIIRTLWPIPEKFLSTVFLSENDYNYNWLPKQNEIVKIKALDNIIIAKNINLVIEECDGNNKIFTDKELIDLHRVLKQEMIYLIFAKNSLITLDFFNQRVTLKLTKWQRLRQMVDVETNEQTVLETSMINLNLNKDMECFQIVPATIISLIQQSGGKTKTDEITRTSDIVITDLKTKENIGGLREQLTSIEETIHYALGLKTSPKGAKLARCMLLYGPSGCGKTLMCNAICTDLSKLDKTKCDVRIVRINPGEIFSKFFGETEKNLLSYFDIAYARYPKPTLIVVEDVNVLCSKNETNDLNRRVCVAFINLLDELNSRPEGKRTFLLSTTSQIDAINSSVRRCGRLDVEIEVSAPSPIGRSEILTCLLKKMSHELTVDNIMEIAQITHGYVGADLENLLAHASLQAFKSKRLMLQAIDIHASLTFVKPSAMREVLIESPNVLWSDIGGQANLKRQLQQAIEWPLLYPEKFQRLGLKPPRGILMYGPPGCSKTMIAKALATESKLNFLSIKGPELFSMWVGESERAVREVFRKARQVAPAIIFFDEIDAIGGERGNGTVGRSGSGSSVKERVLTQLLTELDGVEALENVTILAATNRPDMIDKALLRPGRIDRIIYVGLPDPNDRRQIFNIKLSKMPISPEVIVERLVDMTEGYTGAEIQAACHEAALKTLEESFEAEQVSWRHFKYALNIVKPRTNESLLKLYENYMKEV